MSVPASPPAPVTADDDVVVVQNLDFHYEVPGYPSAHVLHSVSLNLPRGTRCLLVGANGVGKSTLLSILCGKHLTPENTVTVLGKPAFFQTLGLSGVSYLGDGWKRTIAFAGHSVPYQADIAVKDMMASLQSEFHVRRDRLMEVLEIDPEWRMHTVSDGQRRRVQIMLGLLRPFQLLMIDEMTVDLDVLARRDFLEYLRSEAEERGATILYATHIFDGMGDVAWATHICHMDQGRVLDVTPVAALEAIAGKRGSYGAFSLYQHVVDFLTDCRTRRRAREAKEAEEKKSRPPPPKKVVRPFADRLDCGFGSGRMNAYR